MDLHEKNFRNNVDDLNRFMFESAFEEGFKSKLREYFLKTKNHQRHVEYSNLMDLLSPGLRGAVAYQTHRVWVERIHYLANSNAEFVAEGRRLVGLFW